MMSLLNPVEGLIRQYKPKMFVFGVFLILLSVCNSHPQNRNDLPPLDAGAETTSSGAEPQLKLLKNERIKRQVNASENTASNSSLSSSIPNSALQVSSPSPNLLVTTSQPAFNNSQLNSASNSSFTSPSRVNSNASNIVSTSTNRDPDSSGDDNPSTRLSSGRSLDVGNTSNVAMEGSGNGTEGNSEEGQVVEGSSQASLNSSDINVTNSTLEETSDVSNSTNVIVSDNEGVESNQGQPTTNQIDLQTQIYIVSGTLGGVILLLILLVLALALAIARIKDQLPKNRQNKYELQNHPAENLTPTRGYGVSDTVNTSYTNNAFNGGHEMEERAVDSKTTAERMGYEMYNGRRNTENKNSDGSNETAIPRARVQNEDNSFDGGNRSDYVHRNPNSRRPDKHSQQSNHQLRLEEGVSPVRSHDNRDRERQHNQRNRYRDDN